MSMDLAQLATILGGTVPGYGVGVDYPRGTMEASTSPKPRSPAHVVRGASLSPAKLSVFWPKISSQIPGLPGWCFQIYNSNQMLPAVGAHPPLASAR